MNNNLKDGEIWFFGSIHTDNKKYKKFIFGHMGISFNRKDFFDKDKNIYAFGPTRNYNDENELFVPGNFRDDILYFRSFHSICSNNKNPIYKINIKYDDDNAKKIIQYLDANIDNSKLTYSDPLTAGKEFSDNFDDKEKFNNCITFITNNINHMIEKNNKFFNSKYNDNYITHIPG